MNEYIFDVDKIVAFLNRFKNDLPLLYKWKSRTQGLVDLGILSQFRADELSMMAPFEKELILKELLREKLNYFYDRNKEVFNNLSLWIVKEWGGISGAKDSNTLQLVDEFIVQKTLPFKRIASTSKVGSFMFPEKNIIYDSRVVFSLNWILLSENAANFFFPIPKGRNTKMSALDMDVLIRLKHLAHYTPKAISELDDRLYINKQDKLKYIPEIEAYDQLNKLIISVHQKLWKGKESKKLYYTEMLLFSIADREIFDDMTKRLMLKIG